MAASRDGGRLIRNSAKEPWFWPAPLLSRAKLLTVLAYSSGLTEKDGNDILVAKDVE